MGPCLQIKVGQQTKGKGQKASKTNCYCSLQSSSRTYRLTSALVEHQETKERTYDHNLQQPCTYNFCCQIHLLEIYSRSYAPERQWPPHIFIGEHPYPNKLHPRHHRCKVPLPQHSTHRWYQCSPQQTLPLSDQMSIPPETMTDLLKIVLEQNYYFQFADRMYYQVQGTAMGTNY